MKVVMLTGNGLRHRYVAKVVAERVDLIGLVSETKRDPVSPTLDLCGDDKEVLERHFAERDEAECRYLGEISRFAAWDVLSVPYGGSNDPETFEWVASRRPDYIALYGTSIIKPPLLDFFNGRIVNIHLGLSPYYRGSGTNFWPLVNRQPECVGATIHLAVAKVDAGAILGHVRPIPALDDRAHDLGTKTIVAAAEALPRLMKAHAAGLAPRDQAASVGCEYKRKDFNPNAVRRMWHQFETRMMEEFLADKDTRYARYPIIEPGRDQL